MTDTRNPFDTLRENPFEAEPEAEAEAEADEYAIGSIWYTSWGYDQTNVDFFEVVKATPGTVLLERIASRFENGREYPQPGVAIEDLLGATWKRCRKSKWGSLRIDKVRRAYPYSDREGVYSTDASGGAGH